MLDKLEKIAQRLAQVERQLSDPAVYSDRAAMTKLSREQKELTPVVEAYRAYARAEADMAAATEMLSDPELKELGQEELAAAKAERERLEDELKRLLLPKDPNDDKDVVLEIRAGIGGEEGALFAADLLRMYSMYAERRGFTLDVVSLNETELGGVKEAVATVEGAGAYSRLKFEAGTHRVQRVPETAVSRPPPPPWPSCPRRRRWSSPSTPRTCRSTPTAPAAQAASTSTRPSPPSASPTCPPARWWSARTSAASTKTETGP